AGRGRRRRYGRRGRGPGASALRGAPGRARRRRSVSVPPGGAAPALLDAAREPVRALAEGDGDLDRRRKPRVPGERPAGVAVWPTADEAQATAASERSHLDRRRSEARKREEGSVGGRLDPACPHDAQGRARRRLRADGSARPPALGGFGGMPLVVRARWSFRGKDAGSVDSRSGKYPFEGERV